MTPNEQDRSLFEDELQRAVDAIYIKQRRTSDEITFNDVEDAYCSLKSGRVGFPDTHVGMAEAWLCANTNADGETDLLLNTVGDGRWVINEQALSAEVKVARMKGRQPPTPPRKRRSGGWVQVRSTYFDRR